MRLIMMGTGPFAVPTLQALYSSPHQVLLLVTRPTGDVRGKTAGEVNPMRELGQQRGSPIFEPASINTPESQAELARYAADLFVVCDYGQILAPATLAIARLGGVNLHASLLPKYRGAAPINWAIYYGETETGVTVIHMSPRIDAGPAIAQATTPIGAEETAADIEPRLAQVGAPLVLQVIAQLAAGTARPIDQDPTLATKAPRLKKTDGAIDWERPAAAIKNQIRALKPWPKTHTFWLRPDAEPLRLILEEVATEPTAARLPPGTVIEASGDRLLVATGDLALKVNHLQPAGKRVLPAAEFLRGYPVRTGQSFGAA